MKPEDLKNKKIAVIGEGLEGKSSADFLRKNGAKVEIRDKKQGEDDYLEDLNRFDLVVRSPGVRLSELRHVSPDKITSQTKLFFDLSPTKNIIGVTGTKGKGTTSSLIFEMLKTEGKDAYLGGNIGVPPFEFIDKLNSDSWVVLEMSSFQLQDLSKSPHIAVVLMITSDHLDGYGNRNYHDTVEDYVSSKRNILNFQSASDIAIINRDFPASNESDIRTEGKVYYFSREREAEEGCFALGNQVILRIKGNEIPLIDTRELLLRGDHNHENVCAASLAAYLAGVRAGTITQVLKSFRGLEHRLELIDKINEVEYYNDSFSATPESTIAAIKSFKNPEILILGGSSKNSDFTELGEVIGESQNIKAIIGIGEEWERIKSEIRNPKSEIMMIEGADSMEKIVTAASKMAVPGDVVLLSPACASFGMFQNYKDRGEQFKEEVKKLKQQLD
ncbi:MAG: UDP-N-acetylmuramoyl-L-alanine--D-glutamate ligase [Candidatus Levybacteria bacterium]|nr:UDP-N-acetylmuramoyl-L-alanine--D-glutamate ligase [Candidatus Levybacteria bacterium]